jgi:hypothetical protein
MSLSDIGEFVVFVDDLSEGRPAVVLRRVGVSGGPRSDLSSRQRALHAQLPGDAVRLTLGSSLP